MNQPLIVLDAGEQRLLRERVERDGYAPVYRAIKISDYTLHSACKGKGVSRQAAELIRTWIAAMAVLLAMSGCAQTQNLPALSTGLDGARNVIAVSCPARTPACEKTLDAYNAAIVAFNRALLAEAVGEAYQPMADQALAALKQLWAALMQVRP